MSINLNDLCFWAKTTEEGLPGIDVFHHTLNVGHVARLIAEKHRATAERFGLKPPVITVLAALHDIGKISQGFQVKCKEWPALNGVHNTAIAQGWQNLEPEHAKVSQFTVQNLLIETGMKLKHAILWAVPVGAHHGRPHKAGERGIDAKAGMSMDANLTCDADWEAHRKEVARRLIESLGELPSGEIARDSPHLWWLAGLISVADWIGSDERYFCPDANQKVDLEESRQHAKNAVEAVGFDRPVLKQGLGFERLFPFPPNDLQNQALEVITEPGVYVIEAPMGMGKTEAALACAYRLICEGKASGIYFALPTQTTSNRIHFRVQKFLDSILLDPRAEQARLIHANSWLIDSVHQPSPAATQGRDSSSDARAARDWFASPKRGLLANFGVGTIDQALLSVVAAKHFFVRRFGLAGKVVILDEVHSYDFYTGTLIKVLCETLESLGCTVILLSATLTTERRSALLGAANGSEDGRYPLVSGRVTGGPIIEPRPAEGPEDKPVRTRFGENDRLLAGAWEWACAGACVLWICNTVARAQSTYSSLAELREQAGDSNIPRLGLLHSRFPHFKREELENYWMAALGKDDPHKVSKRPTGCVLVSTQVVEQSVDLDADLLITDLAPTDMLLQRIGRLWRHERGTRPVSEAQCWVVQENATLDELRAMDRKRIADTLGTKAAVYAPYVLLRSLEVWQKHDGQYIQIPSQIRSLIRETYDERDNDPMGWLALFEEMDGKRLTLQHIALTNANIWNITLNDEEGVQTRVTDVPTVQLILATTIDGKKIQLLNGESVNLSGEQFRISDARALHRNIVRVPKSVFADFTTTKLTKRYVKGEQAVVIVKADGRVEVPGLKEGRALFLSDVLGIEVRKGQMERSNDEPCD